MALQNHHTKSKKACISPKAKLCHNRMPAQVDHETSFQRFFFLREFLYSCLQGFLLCFFKGAIPPVSVMYEREQPRKSPSILQQRNIEMKPLEWCPVVKPISSTRRALPKYQYREPLGKVCFHVHCHINPTMFPVITGYPFGRRCVGNKNSACGFRLQSKATYARITVYCEQQLLSCLIHS